MIDAALIYIAVASALTFILYGLDKHYARRGTWRISERTLLFSSFIGGALGGLFAMLTFRHKTRRPLFFAVNALSLLFHVAVVAFLGELG